MDERIQELIERVDEARATLAAYRTQEELEQRRAAVRAALGTLDAYLWERRHEGETVAQVRSRLAPEVDW